MNTSLFRILNLQRFSKNRKCAACNGVEKYNTWQQTILCRYDDAIVSYEERNDYILTHCGLVSEPPETAKTSFNSLLCKPAAIDECNITGEWDFLDLEMEQACKTYDMEYRHEFIIKGRVFYYQTFKNVFCFMCNKKKGFVVEPKCLTEIKEVKNEKSLSGLPALTAVFDARPEEVRSFSKCKPDEIEDHLLGNCKQLYCPFGKTAVFGRCQSDIRLMFASLSTSFTIKINQLQESEVTDKITDALLQEVSKKVYAASCNFCQISFHNQTLLIITTATTRRCSVYKLLKLQEFFTRMGTLSFTLDNANYDAQMTQSFINLLDDGEPETFRLLYGDQNQFCTDKIHLDPKFYCKRIMYSVPELIAGGVQNNTIDTIIKHSALIDNRNQDPTQYVICMEDYVLFENRATSINACFWVMISIGLLATFE